MDLPYDTIKLKSFFIGGSKHIFLRNPNFL